MRKKFNVTGSCNPERHYMVDTAERFAAVEKLIDAGEYFTINRARQYGKTTMLQTIRRRLSDKYLVIKTSFEGLGDESFKGEEAFVRMIIGRFAKELAFNGNDVRLKSIWDDDSILDFDKLGEAITNFCMAYPKPVVVLIDEVDKSSDNQTFVSKPIINGIGFYYAEPQTRDNRRMDLVVTYDKQEFVIELKIWHGDKYEELGRDQLSDYLTIRGMNEGYLVTFDFSKNKQDVEPQWIEWNGKRIFEVIV